MQTVPICRPAARLTRVFRLSQSDGSLPKSHHSIFSAKLSTVLAAGKCYPDPLQQHPCPTSTCAWQVSPPNVARLRQPDSRLALRSLLPALLSWGLPSSILSIFQTLCRSGYV